MQLIGSGSAQCGRPSSWSGSRNVPRFASFLPSIFPEDLILSVAWILKYLLILQTAPRGFGERAPVAKKNGAIQSRSPCEGEIGESNHGALVLEFLWFREPRFCCDAVADEISATWNFHLVRKGQFSRYKVDAEHSYASKNRVAKTVAPLFISSSQHSNN